MPMNTAADHRSGPAPRHKAIRISDRRIPTWKTGFRDHTSANITTIDRHCSEVRQALGHMFQRLSLKKPRCWSRPVFVEQAHFATNRRHLVVHAKDVAAAFDD